MKCLCAHKTDKDDWLDLEFYTEEGEIEHGAAVASVAVEAMTGVRFGSSGMVRALYACPKCGTVRIAL